MNRRNLEARAEALFNRSREGESPLAYGVRNVLRGHLYKEYRKALQTGGFKAASRYLDEFEKRGRRISKQFNEISKGMRDSQRLTADDYNMRIGPC